MGAATPVSDAMEHMHESEVALRRFLDAFAAAKVMVIFISNQHLALGDHVVGKGVDLRVSYTAFPDQQNRLLCCADPAAFTERFGRQNFNGEISGRDLFRILLGDKDCPGILVNSAHREMSVIITREQAEWWLQNRAEKPRQWWKLW